MTCFVQVQVGCCDTVRRVLFAAFAASTQCVLENMDSFLTCDANWGRYVTLQLRPGRTAKIPLGNMASPVWARSRPLIVRKAVCVFAAADLICAGLVVGASARQRRHPKDCAAGQRVSIESSSSGFRL